MTGQIFFLSKLAIRRFLFLVFLFLFTFHVSLFAAVSVSTSIVSNQKAPQGQKVSLMRISVQASVQAETINSFLIQNNALGVRFKQGIREVSIYKDNNGNTSFDEGSDTLLVTSDFGSNDGTGTQTLDISDDSIDIGSTRHYFVVYTVDSNASVDATTNITLVDVVPLSGLNPDLNSVTTQSTATISGIKTLSVEDVSPATVLPGETLVPMLKMTMSVAGESIDNNYSIKIDNDSENFVTTTNQTNGISRAYIYLQKFANEDFNANNDILLETLRPSDISSASQIEFTKLNASPTFSIFQRDATYVFFVVYDIGDNIDVDGTTKVQAQLSSFTGTGANSDLSITGASFLPKPDDPAEADVAGLTYFSLRDIDKDDTFGQGSVVPMLSFFLRANHVPITLNRVVVNNLDPPSLSGELDANTVPFAQDEGATQGLIRLQIYEDSNGDGEFDGVNSSDTLVGNLVLDGSNNNDYQANVEINSGSGLLISEYNSSTSVLYPSNNERKFFVVYHVGSGSIPSATNASGNVTSEATAYLANAVGSANVSNTVITMNLRGTLPVSSTEPSTVSLVRTNLYISDISDNSPASALRGQLKVPVLYMKLQPDLAQNTTITSASMTIKNEVSSALNRFSPVGAGISRIWLYRDENDSQTGVPNQKLDANDTLLASRKFEIGASPSEALLNGIPFLTNELQNLMLFYDVGQEATVAASSTQAQLGGVASSSGTTVIFGGELPAPKEAAKFEVKDKLLTLTSVAATGDDDGLTTTFDVQVVVSNATASAVRIDQLFPRVYLGDVEGKDISSEFTFRTFQAFPVTLNASSTLSVDFEARQTTEVSEGTSLLDGYVLYQTPDSNTAELNRYLGSTNWKSAAQTPDQIVLAPPSTTRYFWDYPAYVEKVEHSASSNRKTFQSGNAVPKNSALYITLKDNGRSIDESSLSLTLGGVAQSRRSTTGTLTSGTYSYDTTTGEIVLADLGNTDVDLVLSATDLEGNALSDLDLSFKISQSAVVLSDALFYPNPYRIASETLKLGYNLTREAETVTIYIYSYLGQQILKDERSQSSGDTGLDVGYNLVEYPASSSFLESGIFICKVVAQDADGNESVVTTRLAIY